MSETNPVQNLEKLTRVWSSRREKEIAVRIRYEVREAGGCRIFCLSQVEELD